MKVKIDTKEKFTVITPLEENLSDNIAAELSHSVLFYLQQDTKNVVLNLHKVSFLTITAAKLLAELQQKFYENNASFVICEVQKPVEETFEKEELLEMMNITPSESEAWDIVQMEEIERELLDSDDIDFNTNE